MLKRQNRLPIRGAIHFQNSVPSPLFLFRFTKNNIGHNRYGFIISKKVDKKATTRNSLKRMLALIVREKDATLKSGYDMLFVVRLKMAQVDKNVVELAVSEVFQKSQLLL